MMSQQEKIIARVHRSIELLTEAIRFANRGFLLTQHCRALVLCRDDRRSRHRIEVRRSANLVPRPIWDIFRIMR